MEAIALKLFDVIASAVATLAADAVVRRWRGWQLRRNGIVG